jgi:hypothetical protein
VVDGSVSVLHPHIEAVVVSAAHVSTSPMAVSNPLVMSNTQLSAFFYTGKCGNSDIWASVYYYRGLSGYF